MMRVGSSAPRGLGRRAFVTGAVGSLAAGALAQAAPQRSGRGATIFLAAVGPQIISYRVDAAAATLTRVGVTAVPQMVQYAWRHPRFDLVYVAYSSALAPKPGNEHGLAILRLAPDGTLTEAFPPLTMAQRPIHVSVDPNGRTLLVAYPSPSKVTVHNLMADGRPGPAIDQAGRLDMGIYAHQVRVAPDDRTVVLVTRGIGATPGKPEDPGALKTFRLVGGQLTDEHSVAPGGGFGFGPRHLDFHPTKPWVYVSMERSSELKMFALRDGRLAEAPSFTKTTLADTGPLRPRQLSAAIHISRDGRFVYVANRNDGVKDVDGQKVSAGGENSIAVYRIDPRTGEPTLIQSIGTQTFNPRTFSIDPTGTLLVSASIMPLQVLEGGKVVTVSAALTVFRIRRDGQLEFVRKYDIPTGAEQMFWSGMVG